MGDRDYGKITKYENQISNLRILKRCCCGPSITKTVLKILSPFLIYFIICIISMTIGVGFNVGYSKIYDLDYEISSGKHSYRNGTQYINECTKSNLCCDFTVFGFLLGCWTVSSLPIAIIGSIILVIGMVVIIIYIFYSIISDVIKDNWKKAFLYESYIAEKMNNV